MTSVRFWTAARNAVLKVFAFWVLLLAAYLALGRQFFPYIDRIQPEVEVWLSGQLGTDVEIGELRGEWVRFNPVMHLSDVTLGDDIHIAQLTMAPGIYESISRGGLSFIRFELIDFSAELVELEDGWSLRGLDSNSGSMDLSELLALLQRQQEVNFSGTELVVKPLTLPEFQLTLQAGRLVGYGEENSLVARATVAANDVDVPIELQIETSQQSGRMNRVYFRHGDIDISPWLRELNRRISTAFASGEYWLNLDGEQWQDMTVRLNTSRLVYQGDYNQIQLTEGQIESYIERRQNGVESWLNVLGYRIGDTSYGTAQAKLSYRADRLKVEWDSLPADLTGLMLSLDDPNAFWSSLSPRGYLEQGVLTLSPEVPQSLRLTADVADLAISAHQGVPGMDNLNGTVKIQGNRGRLEISSPQSDFELPGLYSNAFQARIEQTSLNWTIAPERGLYASGAGNITLLSASGPTINTLSTALPLSVQWSSVSPTQQQRQSGREALIDVRVTGRDVPRPWAIELADNAQLAPATVAWMDERIEQALFSEIHLNYLASTDVDGQAVSQFFLESEFEQARVSFLDNWYALDNLSGEISVDNDGLRVMGQQGRYPGFSVSDYVISLDYSSAELRSDFRLSAGVSDALGFLQTGPLRAKVGSQLDSWAAEGDVSAQLSLQVPLASPQDFDLALQAELSAATLDIDNIDMSFDRISGTLKYDTADGLSTQDLSLYHQGFAQQVSVRNRFDSAQSPFDIHAEGRTPLVYWGERFDDRYLVTQDASIRHVTDIQIRDSETEIQSRSNLAGMALNFPEPLTKAEQDRWPLDLSVKMDNRDWVVVRATLNERLQAYMEFDQNRVIHRGNIAFDSPLNVRDDEGVYFDIKVGAADGPSWWRAIQKLRALYESDQPPEDGIPDFSSLIRSIAIEGDQVQYLAQDWHQVTATLLRNDDAWLVDFDADEGQGQILIPHDDTAIFADIDWLNLATDASAVAFEDEQDPLLTYFPADVPDMQLQINKLIWNDRDLGNWRAEIAHRQGEMQAQDIVGEMPGSVLTGELNWSREGNNHETVFQGDVLVGDIQALLSTWNYAPVLTSTSGSFALDTRWEGSPAFFDFKRISGDIDLQLNKGSILQVDEYEGLKLIGLLNFTRVIQRLALDFSDLLQSGITFDIVEGELLFDRGFARVGEKLVIDGSATKFKFSGDADLLSDEVDIDMVFTVPLSSTFPLVALLAGVSPQAAAAIYVTERVFNNELERLSSARMHITGSFDDPQTRFYRVFDNNLGEESPSVTDRVIQVVPEGVASQ